MGRPAAFFAKAGPLSDARRRSPSISRRIKVICFVGFPSPSWHATNVAKEAGTKPHRRPLKTPSRKPTQSSLFRNFAEVQNRHRRNGLTSRRVDSGSSAATAVILSGNNTLTPRLFIISSVRAALDAEIPRHWLGPRHQPQARAHDERRRDGGGRAG